MKEIRSIGNARAQYMAQFTAFALSVATNHNTFLQVHYSITCKSLRSAHALPCAADLLHPGLVHTLPYY